MMPYVKHQIILCNFKLDVYFSFEDKNCEKNMEVIYSYFIVSFLTRSTLGSLKL